MQTARARVVTRLLRGAAQSLETGHNTSPSQSLISRRHLQAASATLSKPQSATLLYIHIDISQSSAFAIRFYNIYIEALYNKNLFYRNFILALHDQHSLMCKCYIVEFLISDLHTHQACYPLEKFRYNKKNIFDRLKIDI